MVHGRNSFIEVIVSSFDKLGFGILRALDNMFPTLSTSHFPVLVPPASLQSSGRTVNSKLRMNG